MNVRLLLVTGILCVLPFGTQTPSFARQLPSVQELLSRHAKTRGVQEWGGQERESLKALRFTGTALYGRNDPRIEAEWAQVLERPNKVRTEVTLQGMTGVEAFDGTQGWHMEPFGGRKEPEKLSADESKDLLREAEAGFEGPLLAAKRLGYGIESLGTEEQEGTSCYKLRVTRKDGDRQYVYLDPDAYLITKVVTEQRIRGSLRVTEADYGGYAEVAGFWLPLSIETGEKGRPRDTRITITSVTENALLSEEAFRFPEKNRRVGRLIEKGAPLPLPKGPSRDGARSEAASVETAKEGPSLDEGILSGLRGRNLGPAIMSGRVSSVAALNKGGQTLVYVGAASGGVWKSEDSGTRFAPIFDKMKVQSIGAIALDPSRENTVWVGTGEAWTRNSVSIGDGIYRSDDGGTTWQHKGLATSERIARILVHPKRSDVVYVCVPGPLWSDSKDRGLYKTENGGQTWSLILPGENLSTGCGSVAMDPKNPEILFASLWDFRRKGWTFRSGGGSPNEKSGSALLRTSDGGKTWQKLSGKGLPQGPLGRIEVTVAPSDEKIVYAFIESTDSALYRSADGGQTWEARDKSQGMVWRPFYFGRLVVDPKRPERVFKAGLSLTVSEDGGKSFGNAGGESHGDWHDLWIDPQNDKHLIGGDDGGLWISHDGGNRWWKTNNLPIAQFYHVAVDNKDPYQVYGGLQDNSSWVGDSAHPGGVTNQRWEPLYYGDGFWTLPDPLNDRYVYAEAQGGYLARVDRLTKNVRDIQPKSGYKEKLRFNWNTPIHIGQKGVLYVGAQVLFRSKDRGETWERISKDLTTDDKSKQEQELSGGITIDNSAAEMHTTIYAISESPKDPNVLWVGTDDGNVQLSQDGGKRWQNLSANLKDLPPHSWITSIEASPHDRNTAYLTADRHTFGEMAPYAYKTKDLGKTWTRIASGSQGIRGYAHTIRQDPVVPNLLYLGTEFGLFLSANDGITWASWKGGDFPAVAVRDIQIHKRDHDLILGTHGRGIWIIDDLTPLRALSQKPEWLSKEVVLLPSRPQEQRMPAFGGWVEGDASFRGENPPQGAMIAFYQKSRHLRGTLSVQILDQNGKVVETLPAPQRRGLNRLTWSMRAKPPQVPRAAQMAYSATQGPRLPPGTYRVRLLKGAEVTEGKIEVVVDRRASYGKAERAEHYAVMMRAHALFGDMSAVCKRIDEALAGADKNPTNETAKALAGRLREIKKKIVATKEGGAITGEERLREHLEILYGALASYEGRPAKYQVDRLEVLRRELGDVEAELTQVLQDPKAR